MHTCFDSPVEGGRSRYACMGRLGKTAGVPAALFLRLWKPCSLFWTVLRSLWTAEAGEKSGRAPRVSAERRWTLPGTHDEPDRKYATLLQPAQPAPLSNLRLAEIGPILD